MSTNHAFMCYIEEGGAIHGTICSQYMEHGWYSDLNSRSIKLIFELGSTLTMRYLAFAVSSDNVNWEVLHVQDSQNNTDADVTIPETYDGTVKFGIKLYDAPPTVGSILNVGFDYVITGGIEIMATTPSDVKKIAMSCATTGATIKYTLDGTDPTDESTDYIEEIEVEVPVTIKARGYKDGLLDGDVATLVFDEIVLETPVLTTQESGGNIYAVLSNVDDYPDDALVYYSNTLSNPLEGTEYMTISSLKNASVKGAIAILTIGLATLFVAVSCDGYQDSDVGNIDYEFPTLQTPTLSITRSGTTVNGTIGNTVSGATYRYKVGSEPTSETDGTVISGTSFSFTNSSAVTVYVKGFMNNYHPSASVSDSVSAYVPTCATPSISFSSSTNRVTITCSTSGATIYYRVGSSGGYSVYSGSFTISSSTYVYAYATASGYNQSTVVSKYCSYTAPTPTLPTPDLRLALLPGMGTIACYVYVDNIASYSSGTSFTCVIKNPSGTELHSETKQMNEIDDDGHMLTYWGPQGNTIYVTVTASCSGYKNSSATDSIVLNPFG